MSRLILSCRAGIGGSRGETNFSELAVAPEARVEPALHQRVPETG